ncbi:MAG: RNA polymerase sigma factor [Acidimicrobiales bacterium]
MTSQHGRARGRNDATLLHAMADGDRTALDEFYEHHAAWLLARLSYRCADANVVNQAMHDAFLAVWRKPGAYRGEGEVAAWLWGIAIRRLIDQLRRERRHAQQALAKDETMVSAEEQVLVGVAHGDLAGAIESLSPELRAVVQATVLDGLTNREAAQLLGIPQGTVKTRMARARLELRSTITRTALT